MSEGLGVTGRPLLGCAFWWLFVQRELGNYGLCLMPVNASNSLKLGALDGRSPKKEFFPRSNSRLRDGISRLRANLWPRVGDGLELFLREAEESGALPVPVQRPVLKGTLGRGDFELFELRGIQALTRGAMDRVRKGVCLVTPNVRANPASGGRYCKPGRRRW